MEQKLYLNNKLVDLPEGGKITRKLQVGDIGDISKRNSNFSYTFKLPMTANNVQILDMLGTLGNTSRKPYERVRADYTVDTLPLVNNGYAVIKSTGKDYDVNIFDGSIDLVERLSGKKLNELNFADLNHFLSTSTVVGSLSNEDGYIYGIGDFGLNTGGSIYKTENLAPSLYVHTIWKKIFEEANIDYNGDFFTQNTNFLTEVITPVKGYDVIDSNSDYTDVGDVETDGIDKAMISASFINVNQKHTITETVTGASKVDNELVFSVAGTYRFNITTDWSNNKTDLRTRVKLNGSNVATKLLPNSLTHDTITWLILLAVEVGDKVSFWAEGRSYYEPDETGKYYVDFEIQHNMTVEMSEGGQLIDFSLFTSDMAQIDFVKDVIQRYGLILHPIQNSTAYRFSQLETLLEDRADAEDWTEKVQEIKDTAYDSGYARENIAEYVYPKDTIIKGYDGKLTVNNDNAPQSKSLFKSPYEITIKKRTNYLIPIWGYDDDAQRSNLETPVKIFRIDRRNESATFKTFSESTGTTVSSNVPFLSLVDMSLQYFLDTYYVSFNNLINDYREVDAEFNLSSNEVYNLDFFKLKYLRQTGRYYYLNNLTYTAGETSKAKLLQINL